MSARATARSTARGFIPELDGVRGLAILLVMVHRFWPRTGVGVAADAAGAGWIGVDLFFVVSGFLITGILLDTREEPTFFKNFYARRVLRIFPLYYLFVGGVLLVFYTTSADFRAHAGNPLWYLLYLGNIPEGVLGLDVPYWLAPVWSLAIEEQFYLTFPWLVRAVSVRRLTQILVGFVIAAPLIRALGMVAFPELDRLQYLFTLCRLDTIAIGCLLAVGVRTLDVERHRGTILRGAGAVVGVAVVIALVTGLDRTTTFGRTLGYSVVAIGCAAALAVVLLLRDAAATAPLRNRGLRYLGKLCFGLYLLHRPADTIVSAVAARVGFDHGIWIIPLKVAFAVGLASISWFVFEKRFLGLKRYFESARHPGVGLEAAPSKPRSTLGRAGVVTLLALAPLVGCTGSSSTSPDAGVNLDGNGDDVDAGADAWTDITPYDGGEPMDDSGDDTTDDSGDDTTDSGDDTSDDSSDDMTDDSSDDASDDGGPPLGTIIYPEGEPHSPLPLALVAHLQQIAGADVTPLFAKVGDSITASPSFFFCFDGAPDLGAYGGLAATLARYRDARIPSTATSPFGRTSVAAVGGTTAADVIAGSPSPLDRELEATTARIALVMFGTNEIRTGGAYAPALASLWTVVDTLIARGVIPVLSTIPPLNDYPEADARIPTFNRLVRAIAQGRGIPLVDFHAQLLALPARGLSADDLHPSVSPDGACALTAAGLQYGYNVRNLLELEALSRVDAAVAGTASSPSASFMPGTGTSTDPFHAPLPLSALGTTTGGDDSPCGTGHARVYELTVPTATLDAIVIGRAPASVHILDASGCHASPFAVTAGTVRVVVTSSTDGEFLLAVSAR